MGTSDNNLFYGLTSREPYICVIRHDVMAFDVVGVWNLNAKYRELIQF